MSEPLLRRLYILQGPFWQDNSLKKHKKVDFYLLIA